MKRLIISIFCAVFFGFGWNSGSYGEFFETFANPPRQYSLTPFWFWNDTLSDEEIVRQIDAFHSSGVYGFVIHPRIGLPEDTGWMSEKLLHAMRTAIDAASARQMYVILYDEGMYPSGSSAGQVAAENPRFAARGLFKVELKSDQPLPETDPLWDFITELKRPDGTRLAIYERPSGGRIRGLHYIDEGTRRQREYEPAAGDILSPEAVACFRRLVYERYYKEFGDQFGKTILGIFTDEPSELGRGPQKGLVPGNRRAIKRVSEIVGYDFTPYLADLWFSDTPESPARRRAYYQALHQVLLETYYQPLSQWCAAHNIFLTGHPGASNDLGSESVFQIPGQDIVWRYVEPGEKALVGIHSTNAKVASSAMINYSRTRNLNELYGAYGHNLTFDEVKWLANWTLIRGQNLLVPHAFYYSVRGPRHEERPPDVGLNAPWKDQLKPFADYCRRLCWMNSGTPVIETAILTDGVAVADKPVRPLFEYQIDFNYLELRQLIEEGKPIEDQGRIGGVQVGPIVYRAFVLPSREERIPVGFEQSAIIQRLADAGRLIKFDANALNIGKSCGPFATESEYVQAIRNIIQPDVRVSGANASGIRLRHVRIEDKNVYILFNESQTAAKISVALPTVNSTETRFWLDGYTGARTAIQPDELKEIVLDAFESRIIVE